LASAVHIPARGRTALRTVGRRIRRRRAIPALKERLHVNVELAAPDQFIPVPPGWEVRSPIVTRLGRVTVRHYDFTAQALSKIERGHAEIEPELFRYPAVDPGSFKHALDALLNE
jgi:hypothetical protein